MTKQINVALNDHFINFVNDWESKFYFLVGGYGSSKSYHVGVKLLSKLLAEKRKALVVREVFETIRESCYDLLQEIAENMGVDQLIGSIRIAGLQKYTIISQILLFIIFHIPSAPYFQEACMRCMKKKGRRSFRNIAPC